MAKQLKPRRWWAISNAGDIYPKTARKTRAETIKSFVVDGIDWAYCYRQGCRAVRVTVTVESKGEGK